LELGGCDDSSFDPVKDGLYAAKGVVVGEVELRRRLVALPNNRVTPVLLALNLPFQWILLSAGHLCREVLQNHGLSVGVLLCHIPVLFQSDLHWDLLGAVCWVVEAGRRHRVM
jgi:hypothetical protein